jgi:hypothetical protein
MELKPSSTSVKTLLSDAEGRMLASSFRYGKGRVVTVAPMWMAPRIADGNAAVVNTRLGKIRFMFTEYILSRLQRDLFPFKVKGDCQYGANRRADGWWLWMMNNNGITKYADCHQIVDPSAASDVSVGLGRVKASRIRELMSGREVKVGDGRFSWTIPPGEIAVFEIVE